MTAAYSPALLATQPVERAGQQVAAAEEYLGKLGQSCGALLSHYEARVPAVLRTEDARAFWEIDPVSRTNPKNSKNLGHFEVPLPKSL